MLLSASMLLSCLKSIYPLHYVSDIAIPVFGAQDLIYPSFTILTLAFIVVFRFWRIIKLVAGILITTKAPGKARFQNQIDKLEDEVMVLQANGEIKQAEIEKLESEILELKKSNEDLANQNSELKRKIYKENYVTE